MLKKIISWFRNKKQVVSQHISDALQEHVSFCDPLDVKKVYQESETLADFIKKIDVN